MLCLLKQKRRTAQPAQTHSAAPHSKCNNSNPSTWNENHFSGSLKKHLRCRIGPAPTMMSPYVIIALTVAVTSYSGAQYFLEGNLVIYLPAGPFRLNYSRKNKRLITLGDSALPPDHPASLHRSLGVSIQAASLAWMLDERWLGGGGELLLKQLEKTIQMSFSVHVVPLLVFSFCRPQSKSITTIRSRNHRASNQNVNASRERACWKCNRSSGGLTYQSVLLLMTENPSHPRPSFSSFPSVLKCRRARYIEIQEVIWQRWWGLQQPKGSPQVKAFSFSFFFFTSSSATYGWALMSTTHFLPPLSEKQNLATNGK